MKSFIALTVITLGSSRLVHAQTASPAKPAQPAPQAPLKLESLDPTTKADPFPPANPKNFTAATPTVATVDAFLHTLWGYDTNRIWRVEAIQTTEAAGVSRVVVMVSEKTPNAQVQNAVFFILPDGKHMVAGSSLASFGEKPFEGYAKLLAAQADGPAKGSASKDLLLVEFSDLQCPHCKDAQPTMKNLEQDYPKARIVYQPFPLVEIHPFAFQAAAYGLCVAKQSNDAYFTYAQAVYDTQGALTPESGEGALKAAVTKAGIDPATVAACAATAAIKDQLGASIKLGQDVGVDQTPMLAVNGRLLPLGGLSYETLRKIIDFTILQDGILGMAPAGLTK